MTAKQIKCLVAVCETTHTTHDSEDVVIDSEHKSVRGNSSACDEPERCRFWRSCMFQMVLFLVLRRMNRRRRHR